MHSDAKKSVYTHNIGFYFLSWKKEAGLVFFERLEPSLNRKVIAENFLFSNEKLGFSCKWATVNNVIA